VSVRAHGAGVLGAVLLSLGAPAASAEVGLGAAFSWRLLELEQSPAGDEATSPRRALSASAVGVTAQVALDGLFGAPPEVSHAGRPGSWLRLGWFGPAALGQGAPLVSGVEVLASVDLDDGEPDWAWSLETAFAWRSFRGGDSTVDHWTPLHVGAALNWRPGGLAWLALGARVDPVLLAAVGLEIPELVVLRSALGGPLLEGAVFARGGLGAPVGRGTELFVLGEFLAQGGIGGGHVTALRTVSLQAGCTF
jgi:hypothetical protein